MKKAACEVLLAVMVVFAMAIMTPAWAQEVTAGIVGTVTDPSGAPLKGAKVTATDTERSTLCTAETNDGGGYNLLRLPVGTYGVKVTAPGFDTAVQPPFTLALNQTARIDVQMKVGGVSETIEVTGATPLLQTQDAQVGTVIDAKTTDSLPLLSRNYLQLALLVPGATNPNPQTLNQAQVLPSSGRPLINGNREQANAYYLDGVANQEKNNNEVAYQPAPDAIEEFNVITQNPSAEFGDFEGGVISASIKSGTNRFHGDVWEFLRNDAFNANTWSAGLSEGLPYVPGTNQPNGVLLKPRVHWNEFGAAVGGPIIKEKLFFFADYQGLRSPKSSSAGYSLFTPSEVSGDFGQLCTQNGGSFNGAGVCSGGTGIQLLYPNGPNAGTPIPNNNLTAAGYTVDPVMANLFALPSYSAAEGVMANSVTGSNYFAPTRSTFNNDQGDLKIDYAISQKSHVFARWSQEYINNPASAAFQLADPGASSTEPVKSGVINWTYAISPSMLNEARVGIVDVQYNQTDYNPAAGNLGQAIGIASANEFSPGLPVLTGGNISFGSNNLEQTFHTGTGEFEDVLIISKGRHTIHTGFQYWRDRLNYVYPGNNGLLGSISASALTGNGSADLWLGLLGGGGRDAGAAEFGLRDNIFGAFVQDDWRVNDQLTINLGLRFEDHTPRYEIHDREVNFNFATGAYIQESGNNGLYNNYLGKGDWEPRIGFAWSPRIWSGRTVIRGAIGTTSYLEGGGANQNLTTNWPLTKISSTITSVNPPPLSNPFPQTAPACATVDQACFTGPTRALGTIKAWQSNYRPANETQWNLSIQQQLDNHTTFQLG